MKFFIKYISSNPIVASHFPPITDCICNFLIIIIIRKTYGAFDFCAMAICAIEGTFSMKYDILGVLILKIVVSGIRDRGCSHPNHHHNLLGHVSGKYTLSLWVIWQHLDCKL